MAYICNGGELSFVENLLHVNILLLAASAWPLKRKVARQRRLAPAARRPPSANSGRVGPILAKGWGAKLLLFSKAARWWPALEMLFAALSLGLGFSGTRTAHWAFQTQCANCKQGLSTMQQQQQQHNGQQLSPKLWPDRRANSRGKQWPQSLVFLRLYMHTNTYIYNAPLPLQMRLTQYTKRKSFHLRRHSHCPRAPVAASLSPCAAEWLPLAASPPSGCSTFRLAPPIVSAPPRRALAHGEWSARQEGRKWRPRRPETCCRRSAAHLAGRPIGAAISPLRGELESGPSWSS